jgi:ribose 5-phosphate isomerase A
VADESKFAEHLNHGVPVEVLPFAARLAERRLKELGGMPVLRLGKMKDGPVITDNGNFVMDVDFGVIEDPAALAAKLCRIPGVVEHGIFYNLDELYLARAGRAERIKRK